MTANPLPYIIAIIITCAIPANISFFTLEGDEAIKLAFTRESADHWEIHIASDEETTAPDTLYGSVHIEEGILILISDAGESHLDLSRLTAPGDTAERSIRDTIDIDGFRFSIDPRPEGLDLRLGSSTDPRAPAQLLRVHWGGGE